MFGSHGYYLSYFYSYGMELELSFHNPKFKLLASKITLNSDTGFQNTEFTILEVVDSNYVITLLNNSIAS